MRNPAFYDRLDSKDRKKIRRIFLQMVGLYMSLIVILFGGVVARSMVTVQSGTSLSQNANLP
jgi:hypothetical protein